MCQPTDLSDDLFVARLTRRPTDLSPDMSVADSESTAKTLPPPTLTGSQNPQQTQYPLIPDSPAVRVWVDNV